MRFAFNGFFVFLFVALLGASGFSGEPVPCPESPPTETPSTPSTPADSGPSGDSVSTPPGGSPSTTGEQMGSAFNPGAKGSSGGGNDLFDPKDITIGKNPLDHNLVRQYLKSVDKMIDYKKSELKQKETLRREQKQELTRRERNLKVSRNVADRRLKSWVNSWGEHDRAKENVEKIVKELGEINEKLQEKYDGELVHRESKLKINLMYAVQEEQRAKANEKYLEKHLELDLKELKVEVAELEQFKRDMGVAPSDTQNASVPGFGK